MMIYIRKPVIAILTVAIFQSGCASMEQAEEKKSRQYAVQGCITGGAMAGLLTYVIQRNDDNAMTKALFASALGCMAGAVIGFEIGERTEEYADAQHAAESETARNNETVARLQQYNASLEVNISDYDQQIEKIRNSSLSAEEKQESLKKTQKIVTNQRTKATEALSNAELELNEAKKQFVQFKESVSPTEANQWEEQIASLEQEKLILSRHINTLNALDASI